MKKLSNAIFGKESKFHKEESGESVTSERHIHPEYEGATVAPAPVVQERLDREIVYEQAVPTTTIMQPTIQEEARVEARERPAVVHEKVYQVEREEIQPVIHREREKTEIVQIEAPRYESEIRPTIVHERQLPAETRPEIRSANRESELMYQEFGRLHQSSLERAPVEHRVIEKPAIVEEHIRRTVIEEVQPVIHKEVVEPHIIRETLPIYEKIVEAPVVTRIIKEIEGLHIDEHHRHHAHHSQFLAGQFDCMDCKRFHSTGTCTVCSPTLSYEGCQECVRLREKGFVPTQQFVYAQGGTPLTTSGMGMQSTYTSGLQSGYQTTGLTTTRPSGISQPIVYTSGQPLSSGYTTTGMTSGLSSGINQGYSSGLSQPGLSSGVTSGLSQGYSSGLSQPGLSSGVTTGVTSGLATGLGTSGLTSGVYQSGLGSQGLSQPLSQGMSQTGYTSGLSQPLSSGMSQSGYTSGLSQPLSSGISQPGYSSGISQPGMTSGLSQQGISQPGYTSGLTQPGMTSGLSQQGLSQPGMVQQGLNQPYTSGVTQPGMTQSGMTQPGMTQPGYSSGMTQPGYSSGVTQPGYSSGVTQPGMTQSGMTQPGYQSSGLTGGITQGLEQGIATGHPVQGLESGVKQGLANQESQMLNKSAQNFASSVSQSRVLPESSQTQKFL